MRDKNTIKIFLGNLNSDTSPDTLRPLFEKYGEVVECDVLKNFGFVHMTNRQDANKAIAQLDGYNVDGNNMRVELSTGKKGGGGGGGKFDKKGFGGNRGGRPYPQRGGDRDFDRYPYPPLPPLPYDRYDPYYRYYMERERERDAYYARMGQMGGDRGFGGRDRGFPPGLSPRDRMNDRYQDPRDRLMPPRQFMEDRARDSYVRDSARPPPEYYDRKPALGGGTGRTDTAGVGAAGAAAGRGSFSSTVGDFNQRAGMDRPGGGGLGQVGGAQGSVGGASAGGAGDFYRPQPTVQTGGVYGRPGMGGAKPSDSQAQFANDGIFF